MHRPISLLSATGLAAPKARRQPKKEKVSVVQACWRDRKKGRRDAGLFRTPEVDAGQ
jgi:hypothetical protein